MPQRPERCLIDREAAFYAYSRCESVARKRLESILLPTNPWRDKLKLRDMAQATPARPALVDLPLNIFGTSRMNIMRKDPTSRKRPIQEVEDAESGTPPSRVCTSPTRSASTLKSKSPQDYVCSILNNLCIGR